MADVVDQSRDGGSGLAGSLPFDWALIPFDVRCPRCGADLRGSGEPRCTRCALEFTWDQVVPIDALRCMQCNYQLYGLTGDRCPECGAAFDKRTLLDIRRRRSHELFEYEWRRAPSRSWLRTLWRSIPAGRFWNRVSLTDDPQPTALVAFGAVALGLFLIGWPVVLTLAGFVFMLFQPGLRLSNWSVWTGPFGNLAAMKGIFVTTMGGKGTWTTALMGILWCLASFPALMMFQQTIHRFRVKPAHLLRVWSYGSCPALLLAVVPTSAMLVTIATAQARWFLLTLTPLLILLYFAAALSVWRIQRAWKHYLRLPHGWIVAIASQVVAVLAAFALSLPILGVNYMPLLFYDLFLYWRQ